MDVKEQIKRSVSITDVVSMYVDLKPAGKYLKALCPFHTEKTPSFFVMPDKDTFSCFGCNKFGDIFTFTQEIENLSFPEAMNFLIDKYSIPVERNKSGKHFKKESYEEINTLALKYFKESLYDHAEGRTAREYLSGRDIKEETMTTFALGYALNRWDGLYNYLRKKDCDIGKAVELGLLVRNDSGKIYDRFRGRIIFPIFPESGTKAPIAFGGRTIVDDNAKYLNSPDTPLYKKSNHLYGFNLSKEAVREQKSSILVEGYFDVVSLYQHGVQNVAASLGTALTEQQIYLLKRFSEQIVIFYDSDKAGINAAVRGIEKMFEQNINPRIITMKDAKDPDDLIRERGKNAFDRLIAEAPDGFRFLVNLVSNNYSLNVPEQKNSAVREMMTYVSKFSEAIIRDEFIRMTSDFFRVEERHLKNGARPARNRANTGPSPAAGMSLDITPAERSFLEAVIVTPDLIDDILGLFEQDFFSKKILNGLAARNIIVTLLTKYNKTTRGFDDFSELIKPLTDAEKGQFRTIFDAAKTVVPNRDELENLVISSLNSFQQMHQKRDLRKIDQEIKIAERQNNVARVQELIKEKFRLIQDIRKQKQDEKHDPGESTGNDFNANVENNVDDVNNYGFQNENQIQTSM